VFIFYYKHITRIINIILFYFLEWLVRVQVVDMTGPEAKILTGYGSLSQQHAKPGEMPATTSGKHIQCTCNWLVEKYM
jgi:hypothetical protein